MRTTLLFKSSTKLNYSKLKQDQGKMVYFHVHSTTVNLTLNETKLNRT